MIETFFKYLEFEKRVSRHTLLAYQKDLEQFRLFIQNSSPDTTIDFATYGLVRSWIISLVEEGLEPTSVNRKIATLRTFFKFLMRQELITKDPMLKVRVLKTKRKLPTFVKERDLDLMLDNNVAFENTLEGHRDKLILEMFYATGIRLTELISLKENRIDFKNCTIRVLGKRNKERVIPFPESLSAQIRDYQSLRNKELGPLENGLLFVTDKGAPCYPMMIYRRVKKYLRTYTTTEKTSPHVLRHSYATHLLDKGAEINAVKDLLGHTSLAATQVYTHNSIEKIKKVFEQAHPKA